MHGEQVFILGYQVCGQSIGLLSMTTTKNLLGSYWICAELFYNNIIFNQHFNTLHCPGGWQIYLISKIMILIKIKIIYIW